MSLSIIILAAGQGTRMRSVLPKVLHPLGGMPLLQHVIRTAHKLNPGLVTVVYGHGGEHVKEALAHEPVEWVLQERQLGTGHAVDQAMSSVKDEDTVLVLYGDVPLIQADTLAQLVEKAGTGHLAVLTAKLCNPQGYGRMLRNEQGQLVGIVEQKDANESQLVIDEINSGFLAAPAVQLRSWLQRLDNTNAQGEYYLTDVLAMAAGEGVVVESTCATHEYEILGVNDRVQLAQLERIWQQQQAEVLMRSGVTLLDPARLDVRGEVDAGQDCLIDVNVVLGGKVTLGKNVCIGPGCVIKNSTIGDDVEIFAHCVIEDGVIGNACRIGPFARIRPETKLEEQVHVGNFVEIKKSTVAKGSKINHLSYIGDTRMGSGVNVGAGTITCNYDGANKHLTEIGNNVFIGSDTQLVAPVKVGDGATIGAGATITRDVPDNELTLSRCKQQTIAGWKRPVKSKP
ncbi:UDP-N-acetylglucosamine pyrophosphorylase /glucosamine-1-phosphate N-acetyltransferase [Thiogranum longum]|uniref:Bifunctional protein GlmU n=1 Tax=Thiogranum longum TaxID=1537524 RepID=A0A4R1H8Z2_9GAMM|nr:bifunctional UDP-N-acetylglucosamine diphosphorylase/glucosamine-1-phosphate N-acetyltransferase GlmU [Thiogranum longum]TCK16923.1 UDP-N-acetylglucosamine pyrophosphorylase /glucosamine-1-phosphate N-acetyltransferase [Thiogranum longum]